MSQDASDTACIDLNQNAHITAQDLKQTTYTTVSHFSQNEISVEAIMKIIDNKGENTKICKWVSSMIRKKNMVWFSLIVRTRPTETILNRGACVLDASNMHLAGVWMEVSM